MLKSRQHMPPGGFHFYQAETDWKAPEWLSFSGLVDALITHRKANNRFGLPTDRATVENEVDHYNTQRLKAMKGGADYIVGDDPPTMVFPSPRQDRAQAGAAVRVKRVGVAIGTIADWLGDGLEPAPRAQAEARASVCIGCPNNVLGNFWQRMEAKAAAGIRQLVNAKNAMDISTSVDAQLHSCALCDCWIPLKIQVPKEHIVANTDAELLAKLPDFCWVKQEKLSA